MQAALERGWPLAILVQIREKTQNEIQHGADQATPSIQRDGADQATPSIQRGGEDQATPSIQRKTNYVEQDESEEIENQNIEPQGLADEGERIHNIVDEMEAEDQTAIEMEEYKTNRGLCDGCMKKHGNAILAGCPLLLQLWSYERLAVGRPMVSHEHYHGGHVR